MYISGQHIKSSTGVAVVRAGPSRGLRKYTHAQPNLLALLYTPQPINFDIGKSPRPHFLQASQPQELET